jgi:signal transduction histidine kinase
MFFRLRLKTKLVLAISGMVAAIVVAYASIYISQILKQRLNETYESGDFIAHQIFDAARQALEVDLANSPNTSADPEAIQKTAEESLQTDSGLNTLLESVIGYSRPIYDVAVADSQGRALLHTDPKIMSEQRVLPERQDFKQVAQGSWLHQLSIVYGAPRVYEIRVPIERNGMPFGSVRVGISTVFLKSELRPQLDRALAFSGIAIFITFLLAAALSNFALRPLTMIGERLDLMTEGVPDPEPAPKDSDELGLVTTKINRLGRQMRDVKEVFSALKENLDQIMANLQDGLVLFTRDARAILVSAAVERFLRRPRSEMLGHNVGEFLNDQSQLGRTVLDAFESRRGLSQREIETEDGHRVQVSLDFIEESGEIMGALLTLRDAESVRRIEDEIELSHRLSAIGRLASGVGHEVKNPINAIVVHLEVLRQKLQQADPDTRRHMDVIGNEIQRLDRVVQMLVDFTRPVELRLQDCDLNGLVGEVSSLAAPEAERHGVQIQLALPNESVPVRVDVDLFKQALLNVVLNGVQAMPRGGELRVMVDSDEARREAHVRVRDEGGGIAPEIRDKIYNLYFTTKKSGTGIGLAMTYKVMQLHHGSVSFESFEGQGTVFNLTLPLAEKMMEAERELAAHE